MIPRDYRGEANPRARLNDEAVRDIRARRVAGETHEAIARRYKVHLSLVRLIVNRKRWGHVQ